MKNINQTWPSFALKLQFPISRQNARTQLKRKNKTKISEPVLKGCIGRWEKMGGVDVSLCADCANATQKRGFVCISAPFFH